MRLRQPAIAARCQDDAALQRGATATKRRNRAVEIVDLVRDGGEAFELGEHLDRICPEAAGDIGNLQRAIMTSC